MKLLRVLIIIVMLLNLMAVNVLAFGKIFDSDIELTKSFYDGYIDIDGKSKLNTTGTEHAIRWKNEDMYVGTGLRSKLNLGPLRIFPTENYFTTEPCLYIYPAVYVVTNDIEDNGRVGYVEGINDPVFEVFENDVIKVSFIVDYLKNPGQSTGGTKVSVSFVRSDGSTFTKQYHCTWTPSVEQDIEAEATFMVDETYLDGKRAYISSIRFFGGTFANEKFQTFSAGDCYRIHSIKVGINNYNETLPPPEYQEDDYKIYFTNIVKRWWVLTQRWQYNFHGYVSNMQGSELIGGKFSIAQPMDKFLLLWDRNHFDFYPSDIFFEHTCYSTNNYSYLDISFTPNDSNLKRAFFRLNMEDIEGFSFTESNPLLIDTFNNPSYFTDEDYSDHYDEETGRYDDTFWQDIIREHLMSDGGQITPEKRKMEDWLTDDPMNDTRSLLKRILDSLFAPFANLNLILENIATLSNQLTKNAGALIVVWDNFFAWVPSEIISVFALGTMIVVVLRVLGR